MQIFYMYLLSFKEYFTLLYIENCAFGTLDIYIQQSVLNNYF